MSDSKPKMPSIAAQRSAKTGGLGKGLAALIPQRTQTGSIGVAASDVIFGSTPSSKLSEEKPTTNRDGATNPSPTPAVPVSTSQENENKNTTADKNRAEENRSSAKVAPAENRHSDTFAADTYSQDFGATYREIPLDDIRVNPKQPRSVFDEEALNELVHSIREFGLMQPIVVRHAPQDDTTYELIMGERRLRASRKAGLTAIPAIVRETEDEAMLRDALLENIHRVQLNPLEEASAYQQLLQEFGVTQSELAQRLGRSRPLITNMIRLLQLPVPVQRRVGAGVLSSGHARALLGIKKGAEAQEQLADRIVREGLSVRATEEAVTLINRGDDKASKKLSGTTKPQLPEAVRSWATDFGDVLDTKVTVQMGKKKGKIVVEFGGPEDFERITEILKLQGEGQN